MRLLERDWYRPTLTLRTVCLLPFSWLFRMIVAVRRFLYRIRVKKTFQFQVPVIVVGNITVGGTGKTPFVIWLAEQLRQQGFNPGIVSRGVGGNAQIKPGWVTDQSLVNEVGDEALLLLKRTRCPLVIGVDRVACVETLLSKQNCNVVISDDGLQHYRLGRQVEIALIDGARGLGNKQLLPAGPLREPVSRLDEVDFIVRHDARNQVVSEEIPGSNMQWLMSLQGDQIVSVKDNITTLPLQKTRVHAVAAIGNPERFFNFLREKNFEIIPHPFPDHYLFKKEDLAFGDSLPIVMTEKDAVKCGAFASEIVWYVPVESVLDPALFQKIMGAAGLLRRKEHSSQ